MSFTPPTSNYENCNTRKTIIYVFIVNIVLLHFLLIHYGKRNDQSDRESITRMLPAPTTQVTTYVSECECECVRAYLLNGLRGITALLSKMRSKNNETSVAVLISCSLSFRSRVCSERERVRGRECARNSFFLKKSLNLSLEQTNPSWACSIKNYLSMV